MTTALIDADSIIYILGWNNREHTDEKDMELQVDQFMTDIIVKTKATHYLGVFSTSHTFRNDLYPEYKANRKKTEAPEWITFWKPKIIDLCIKKYGFIIADNIEADDVLSLLRDIDGEVIFCSPDKDLRQIPGKHYNYAKDKWEVISETEGAYRFWTSMLVGDTVDNIPGCKGIGEKKAPVILAGCADPIDMKSAVYNAYRANKKYKDLGEAMSQYSLMYSLLVLLHPTLQLSKAEYYKSKIQEVAYEEAELNIETDAVLPDNQRSHEDDLLCSSLGDAEQV